MMKRRLLCTALALSPAAALAQSGDPKFDALLRNIRAEALKAGVDAGTLDSALAKVHEAATKTTSSSPASAATSKP